MMSIRRFFFRPRAVLPMMLVAVLAAAVPQGAHAESAGDALGKIFRDVLGGKGGSEPQELPVQQQARQQEVPRSLSGMQQSFSPLVKETAPAVVNVYADRMVRSRSPFSGDPFFEQFFGQVMPNRTEKQSSLGSGVVVAASGVVITNNHVIEGADDIRVALSDGREFDSRVLLKDERFDIAILKIDGAGPFPTIEFGDSDALEVGDLVLAIGNPFGVGQTVTSGIVSALARNSVGISDFGFFIQTDAAINPGNSGGALIDMNGRLVGINTAIFSRSGGSNGIGFAIPANLVRAVALTAEAGGERFERPYIGAAFEAVTADIAEALGLGQARGALVSSVEPGGPADKAGLQAGDIITGFNGQKIEHPDALGYRLATAGMGSVAALDVITRRGLKRISVPLNPAPADSPSSRRVIQGRNPFSGATVAELSPRLADELRLPSGTRGVVVTEIDRRSLSARYGFQPRDIIVAVNGVDIKRVEDLENVVGEGASLWRFEIIRDGQHMRQFIR